MARPAEPGRRQTPPLEITVLIVDDHPLVRSGLRHLIDDEADLRVVGESDTAAGTLEIVERTKPDVAVVDIALGAESGLELVRTLAAAHPYVRILVLSMHDETLFAERALHAGAHGYVMKSEAMREVLDAIRRVAEGKTYVSDQLSERLLAGFSGRRIAIQEGRPALERLTDRERDVFELLARGLSTREIASQLKVSVKTIETHRTHVQEKLGLRNSHELLRFAALWSQH
jgi:DNA-binding NarL/FixJ family response regulator